MRQTLHYRAPGNWINDPNGLIYYGGFYHLFCQYFPYGPQWGTMHWRHAVSKDLIHWEDCGIALFPSHDEDRNGCYSGSAVETDDGMRLYYTGVHYTGFDPKNIHVRGGHPLISTQMTIASKDGFHFDNFGGKQVAVPAITDPVLGDLENTRDPKVWREGDTWYMVLGSTRDGHGRLLIYRSVDGIAWEQASQLSDERFRTMVECPDLYKVDGRYFLNCSLMKVEDPSRGYTDQSFTFPMDFDPATGKAEVTGESVRMDLGGDFYAPQSNVDADGRRTVIGWVRMPEPVIPDVDPAEDEIPEDLTDPEYMPWRGMMTVPRLIEVRNGKVCFPMHPNVKKYFAEETPRGGCGLIRQRLPEGSGIAFGGFKVFRENGRVCVDRSAGFPKGYPQPTRCETPEIDGECIVEVLYDRNIVEVYVNDGEYVITMCLKS